MSHHRNSLSRRGSAAPTPDFSEANSDGRRSICSSTHGSVYDSEGNSDAEDDVKLAPDVWQTPNTSPKAPLATVEPAGARELDFNDVIDQLLEKRASTREAALKQVIAHLTESYRPGSVQSSFHTLQSYLVRCARRGSSTLESTLACRALSIVYLTAGEEREATFRELSESIRDSMLLRTSGAKAAALRPAVAALLSISCFVAGSDEDCVELSLAMASLMDSEVRHSSALLQASAERSQKVDATLVVTLIQGIGILCSFPALSDDSRTKIRDVLLRCLQHGMPAVVRVAAARTLAMFSERFASASDYSVNFSDSDEDCGDGGEINASSEVLSSMEKMNISSVKSVASSDRKSMKTAFRDVAGYLNGTCTAPTAKIKIGKRTEVISTWVSHVRYEMLKSVLGTGLQAHMVNNDVVRFALDFEDFVETETRENEDTRLRKQINQKSGVVQKLRTMDLKKQRQNKAQRSLI